MHMIVLEKSARRAATAVLVHPSAAQAVALECLPSTGIDDSLGTSGSRLSRLGSAARLLRIGAAAARFSRLGADAMPPLHEQRQEHVDRAFDDASKVAVGLRVPQEIARELELLLQPFGRSELHTIALGRQRLDGGFVS
jgi:hypothetical protein